MEMRQAVGAEPGTILLVDDEPAIIRSYERLFRSVGYTVLKATTVDEAIKLIDQADVIVSDYNMPDGGGERVLEHAKGKPFVFMTASTDEIVHPHIVGKPAMWEDVIGEVERAVMRAKEVEYVSGVGG